MGNALTLPNSLYSNAFPSITGSAGFGPSDPRPKRPRAVSHYRNVVPLSSVFVGLFPIGRDFQADFGHARRVCNADFLRRPCRNLAPDLNLAAEAFVKFECLLAQCSLGVISRFFRRCPLQGLPLVPISSRSPFQLTYLSSVSLRSSCLLKSGVYSQPIGPQYLPT